MVTTGWRHQTHRRAMIVFDQLQAALRTAPDAAQASAFLAQPDNPYFALLDRLYGEDYQLGRLLDTSDLIVHAEGPSLPDALPALRATTWLCETSNRHLRRLLAATMDLSARSRRTIKRGLDLRLTGFAPGSLYAGFRLVPSSSGLFGAEDDAAYHEAREALRGLPQVPRYIGDDALLPDITLAMPDPAVRDASLVAAFHLSPTGKLGVHTLALSTPGDAPSELSQRERVVLRDALSQPSAAGMTPGRFVGEVREMDMDKTRFHLRGVQGVGAVRCVLPDVDRESAKALIGETVSVSGRYATDGEGRPRLLLVDGLDAIRVIDQPKQRALPI